MEYDTIAFFQQPLEPTHLTGFAVLPSANQPGEEENHGDNQKPAVNLEQLNNGVQDRILQGMLQELRKHPPTKEEAQIDSTTP